ncbi:hypothetical protein HanRHA438_Chr04g0171031 [Helianthus annuus]|uniref:Uncharacterized protein n=1 Tax=Helianthus annuus TaxID=4232 RepID=A0A251UZ06_HELAN|nr:hypothetical protein HanXRQr2_Chr04g0160891 [Helianthus annuus]KAJ0580710.1 hypothetical protein HanHA300_Chr04g0132471 [Helianthus annuus]KAJ0596660.1 hypothetical protein HanHA89_Chr04g0145441 [Helianthus annuus]KAJ0757327.1 hypothetical protein HanLR1_Chr04g0137441 [Helianthus annuus]KAJ0761034.1 hypothetical protein HanOQP8_Chr04g0145041 [Helianthus annuus]
MEEELGGSSVSGRFGCVVWLGFGYYGSVLVLTPVEFGSRFGFGFSSGGTDGGGIGGGYQSAQRVQVWVSSGSRQISVGLGSVQPSSSQRGVLSFGSVRYRLDSGFTSEFNTTRFG